MLLQEHPVVLALLLKVLEIEEGSGKVICPAKYAVYALEAISVYMEIDVKLELSKEDSFAWVFE
jgi:hypothetical protein